MRVLVLDFDGVISDSARESFAVALSAYLDLRPGTLLGRLDETSREDLYRRFVDAMPLGNRAEDYGTVLAALEAGAPLTGQAAYDAFRAAMEPPWLETYHRRFYEVRSAMRESDRGAWLALMRPYAPFADLLRGRADEATYALATAKDGASVRILLREYGLADLFPESRVMDKEAGAEKSAHLRSLHERLAVPWSRMTFVDDKVNHLDAVAPLGVRCVLAAWGYNGPREHALARARGYTVCTLDQAGARLFGA
jgi:phosphoglycolate phosphatase-like HAD superfamily hydrolase